MELNVYEDILSFIKKFKGTSRECKRETIKQYPDISEFTLGSIINLQWQFKMIVNHCHIRKIANQLYNRYKSAVNDKEEPGIIIRLASEVDFSPSQLAKLFLEQHYQTDEDIGNSKKEIQKRFKDSTLIEDRDLAFEVYLSILEDDENGPYSDEIKRILGCEYEMKLQEYVSQIGLVYKTEQELQSKGYDKTPDIKLDTPMAVDGFIVNWIESKASFGNEHQHKQYTRDQYQSYWNRLDLKLIFITI
uniref:CDAN1-interacting nuclease 1 n=1 Tax=Clastoptera arizonana TaxID=38151 RepID=A0A1B6CMM6_9HEMI